MAERNPEREAELWRRHRRAQAVLKAIEGQVQPHGRISPARAKRAERRLIDARNSLVTQHLGLVTHAAQRLSERVPSSVTVDDLVAEGVFGIVDAIDAFDPGRGASFPTFAQHKIRSAMLDYLRSLDPVPRLVRQRHRLVEKARQKFLNREGRQPTDEELGKELRLKGPELRRVLRDAEPVSFNSLHASRPDEGIEREQDYTTSLSDPAAPDPAVTVNHRVLRDWLLRRLSRAERLIVMLYYAEGLTMKEIGVTLDLSESRVSQMHSSILARLKAQVAGREMRDLAAALG